MTLEFIYGASVTLRNCRRALIQVPVPGAGFGPLWAVGRTGPNFEVLGPDCGPLELALRPKPAPEARPGDWKRF